MATMTSTTPLSSEPAIRRLPSRRMAVIRTVGDPELVGNRAVGNLYGAVYALRRARAREGSPFDVGPPVARWPNAHTAPREEWVGVWALEVPPDVQQLPRGEAEEPIELQTWPGGEVAEIVHRGAFESEPATVERLHRFAAEQGYEVAGVHEEEYLTRPGAEEPETRIRYRVAPRS